MSAEPILRLETLSVDFPAPRGGRFRVLDRVSLEVGAGETVGILGESGSGKSVTALAVMGLLDRSAVVAGGRILFEGEDLLGLPEARLRRLRGRRLSMVFQHPRRALNPVRPVGKQISDVLRAHAGLSRREARDAAVAMLARVGIPDPAARASAYPHELSGGTCQRVMVALALACAPRLLIADEPTTGLDVTTQALILDLVAGLARERGMAMIFITHDLALAAERCDRLAVMHAGQLVETGPTAAIVERPRHPYTRRLLRATPGTGARLDDLVGVPGLAPDLSRADLPACRFQERCELRIDRCRTEVPPLQPRAPGHCAACWTVAA